MPYPHVIQLDPIDLRRRPAGDVRADVRGPGGHTRPRGRRPGLFARRRRTSGCAAARPDTSGHAVNAPTSERS